MNIASSLLCEIYDVCTYVFIYHLASNYGVGFVYADTVLRMYHKFLVRMNAGLTILLSCIYVIFCNVHIRS